MVQGVSWSAAARVGARSVVADVVTGVKTRGTFINIYTNFVQHKAVATSLGRDLSGSVYTIAAKSIAGEVVAIET